VDDSGIVVVGVTESLLLRYEVTIMTLVGSMLDSFSVLVDDSNNTLESVCVPVGKTEGVATILADIV
jgi:hypothetical protein